MGSCPLYLELTPYLTQVNQQAIAFVSSYKLLSYLLCCVSMDLGVPTLFLLRRAGRSQPVSIPAGVGCGPEQGLLLPRAGRGGSVSLLPRGSDGPATASLGAAWPWCLIQRLGPWPEGCSSNNCPSSSHEGMLVWAPDSSSPQIGHVAGQLSGCFSCT